MEKPVDDLEELSLNNPVAECLNKNELHPCKSTIVEDGKIIDRKCFTNPLQSAYTNNWMGQQSKAERDSIEAKERADQELWDSFQELCSKTTMHGVGHIFSEDSQESFYQSPRRLLWCVAVFLCIGLSIYEVSSAMTDYLSYPVNTAVKMNYPDNMKFPSVTICNNNQIRKSWLMKSPWMPVVVAYSAPPGQATIPINWAAYNWTGFSLDKLMYSAGHQLEEMLFLCKWKGASCGPQHFVQESTFLGGCFTFNYNQSLVVTGAGSANALQLVLKVQQEEYVGNLRSGAGFRIVFSEAHEPTSTDRFAVALQPGTQTLLPIQVQKVAKLPVPYGDCQNGNPLTMFDNYSVPACVFECRSKLAAERCGCREMYPTRIKTDVSVCLPKQYRECLNPVLDEIASKGNCSHCKTPCRYTKFETRMSYSRYPANHIGAVMAAEMNVTADYIRDNFLEVNIYLEEMTYLSIEETPAYTGASLIGVVGGHLGVFMGVSILTMMEFAEFVVCQCKRLKRKTL